MPEDNSRLIAVAVVVAGAMIAGAIFARPDPRYIVAPGSGVTIVDTKEHQVFTCGSTALYLGTPCREAKRSSLDEGEPPPSTP